MSIPGLYVGAFVAREAFQIFENGCQRTVSETIYVNM